MLLLSVYLPKVGAVCVWSCFEWQLFVAIITWFTWKRWRSLKGTMAALRSSLVLCGVRRYAAV